MSPRPALALLLLVLSQPAAAASQKVRLAVLDVRASGGVDEATAQGLSSLIASGMARDDVTVLSPTDLRAMIGFEKQKELLGCSDASCLAEIGGALGVDYLVVTELSRFGGSFLFTLSLVGMHSGGSVHRLTRRAKDHEAVLDAAVEGPRELLARLPRSTPANPAQVAGGGQPSASEAGAQAAGGPEARTAPAGAGSTPFAALPPPASVASGELRRSTLSWLLLGAGSVAAVTGGVFYGRAWSLDGEPMLRIDADAERTRAGLGLSLLGGGVVLGIASLLVPQVSP